MANSYLDKTGLSYFWNKIKTYMNDAFPLIRNGSLSPSGWINNRQTITVNGVSQSIHSQVIIVSPATKSDADKWAFFGVFCVGQTDNGLIFSCDQVPDSYISVRISIQEVRT